MAFYIVKTTFFVYKKIILNNILENILFLKFVGLRKGLTLIQLYLLSTWFFGVIFDELRKAKMTHFWGKIFGPNFAKQIAPYHFC